MVTSTVAGESACRYVRGVPHSLQNVRATGAELPKVAGFPEVKVNLPEGNVTHATTGAAATRRQVRQWHTIVLVGGPSAT